MTFDELKATVNAASSAIYYPYRTARPTGGDPLDRDVELDDVRQFNEMVHHLRTLAGDRAANDNHCVFLVTQADGTAVSLLFSDLTISRGTGVDIHRW